jgi:hypothetical protein
MADDTAEIRINTKVDTDGLKSGLSEAEREVKKSARNQLNAIEDGVREQLRVIKQAEDEKIAEIKRSTQEQIEAVKNAATLDQAAIDEQVSALKQTEADKTAAVQDGAFQQARAVKQAAQEQTETVKQEEKEQLAIIKKSAEEKAKASEKGFHKTGAAVKDFAKGFGNQMLGVDNIMSAVAGGPVAIGAAVADMVKQGVAQLNEYADMWRKTDEAAQKLAIAAESNPYLNGKAAKELAGFADALEQATGLDGDMLLSAETRLVTLGRNQEQIQKILQTAADLDASGLMSFDAAVQELNNSYNGLVRTSGRLAPEIRNLTKEELEAGKAVDILAGKVEGSAARAMDTSAGAVKAYNIAVDNLKKNIGQGWAEVTLPATKFFTNLINKINDAMAAGEKFNEFLKSGTSDANKAAEVSLNRTFVIAGKVERVLYAVSTEMASGFVNQEEAVGKIREAIAQEADYNETNLGLVSAITERYSTIPDNIKDITVEIIRQNKANQALAEAERARNEAMAAGDKQAREALQETVKNERDLDSIRKKNNSALEAEIQKIKERAKIDGKSVESAEIQKQILEARISAYFSLLEEGKEYINILNAERERTIAAHTAGMERVRGLENAEKKAEEERQKREEERQKRKEKELKDIDDVIAKQDELTRSLMNLASDAAGENQKNKRINDIKTILLAETTADDKTLAHYQAMIKKKASAAEEGKREEVAESLALSIAGVEAEKQMTLTTYRSKLDEQKRANEQAIKQINDSELLSDSEKLAKKADLRKQFRQQEADAESYFQEAKIQLERETQDKINKIDMDAGNKNVETAREAFVRKGNIVLKFVDQVMQAAHAIETIWKNSIQNELDAKLAELDKMDLSAAEREEAEKKLRKVAAEEQYKAAYFSWQLQMAQGAANAAQAVLSALSAPGGIGIALAVVAGAVGMLQLAAIKSAEPKRPTFHTGGVVPGSGEVNAKLMGGEVVSTPEQFKNIMNAFANVAGADVSKGAGGLTVNIENNAADAASVGKPEFDGNTLRIVVEKIVNDAIGSGRANQAFAQKDSYDNGINLLTY